MENAGLCMAGQGRGRVGKSRYRGQFGSRCALRLGESSVKNLNLPYYPLRVGYSRGMGFLYRGFIHRGFTVSTYISP